MNRPSPTLTVDLAAIADNVQRISTLLSGDSQVIAVVKANAYGLGAIDVSRAALTGGAMMLAVARGEEVRPLRAFQIQAPILVLGETPIGILEEVASSNTAFTVWDLAQVSDLAQIARSINKLIPVHVEIDSGMHRLGADPELVFDLISKIEAEPGLQLVGMFTHFACADEDDPTSTQRQWSRFQETLAILQDKGVDTGLIHAANSAATVRFPETHAAAVRVGLLLSGISPLKHLPFKITPAVSLNATIIRVATVPALDGIGYGLTDPSPTVRRIATVAIGYADGLRRGPISIRSAILHGRRILRVGRVSMDLTTFDVTHVPAASPGDVVTLIGKDGDEYISVEDVATETNTIPYEVITSISPRVHRKVISIPEPIPVPVAQPERRRI